MVGWRGRGEYFGVKEAVEAVFAQTVVQTCIVHLIRNSMRYVRYRDRKAIATDPRPMGTAMNRDEAQSALPEFERKWSTRYPRSPTHSWKTNWERVVPFSTSPRSAASSLRPTPSSRSARVSGGSSTTGPLPERRVGLQAPLSGPHQAREAVVQSHPRLGSVLGQFAIYFQDRLPVA